ncbi:MAG: hypothetical protein HKN21_01230 [Candidatus Eisenbacteria bacterium]|uniref:AMP-activated protein kinase glycogen-binding domain-containing protein n=1 Tax=Eiseniibacteriota bacterium TaxID=2212470 RepID=A0A7Y2H0W3_UNCEI|nr:hypothetical protein [Candidatus Eisenbacteria bacterium]
MRNMLPKLGLCLLIGFTLVSCDRTRPWPGADANPSGPGNASDASGVVVTTPADQAGSEATGPRKTAEGWVFTFVSPSASMVHLAGSFNDWSTTGDQLTKNAAGVWVITKPLDPGTYQYKFIVNGTDWKVDPNNPNTSDDGFGGSNSELVVP